MTAGISATHSCLRTWLRTFGSSRSVPRSASGLESRSRRSGSSGQAIGYGLSGRQASITPMQSDVGPPRLSSSCAGGTCPARAQKGSPSCGLERVRVRDEHSERQSRQGRGVFAQAVVDALPTLAIEEEGRLHDPGLREHFVNRIFGHARDRDFFAASWTAAQLIRFHSAEKVAVLAHDAETARRLGRLVARQGELEPEVLAQLYRELHAAGLARPSSPGTQANDLMHLVPVTVPLALLGRHLRAVRAEWAYSQAYLRPYPKQLGLRGVIARTPKGRGATPA
jgi:uncharacterized protein YbgA (DUF1722 family)